MKEIDVVIGLVCHADKVLISQRRSQDPLGDYWEFPGGKQEPGESREQCLARELTEELAIRVRVVAALDSIEYDYAAVRVRLHPYFCDLLEGEPQPLASQRLAWATPSEFAQYQFPPANDTLLNLLTERLAANPAKH